MAGDQRDWATDPGGYAEPKRGRLAAMGLARGGGATGGWRIGLGLLDEADGPLGSSGSGALATGGAVTQFVDMAASWPVTAGLEAFGRAALGRTETSSQSGLLADVGPLWSTAFSLGLATRDLARAGDQLSFTVSQPLRVEAGKAVLDVPVARDVEGNVARARRALNLQPDGREIDLEVGYGTAFGSFAGRPGFLRTALMLRLAPDHDPSAPPELLFGLGYRLPF
jgi:hypothetical protein